MHGSGVSWPTLNVVRLVIVVREYLWLKQVLLHVIMHFQRTYIWVSHQNKIHTHNDFCELFKASRCTALTLFHIFNQHRAYNTHFFMDMKRFDDMRQY